MRNPNRVINNTPLSSQENPKYHTDYKELSALANIVDTTQENLGLNLKATIFVCIQHLMHTTISLLQALIDLGAQPQNIFITGKIYSLCPNVARQLKTLGINYFSNSIPEKIGYFEEHFHQDIKRMWQEVEKRIGDNTGYPKNKSDVPTLIVLDDGSKGITTIPLAIAAKYKVCGIEQTSYGSKYIDKYNTLIPVINVAFSAAKQILESDMIAAAVVAKLKSFLPGINLSSKRIRCGVVGLGSIGRAITTTLMDLGYQVVGHDIRVENQNMIQINGSKVLIEDSIGNLIRKVDCLFGCTGEDISLELDLNEIRHNKHFVSCSSQDIEFKTVLRKIQIEGNTKIENILQDIEYTNKNHALIKIYRGGFPINLDNSGTSVPPKDIQLTRALLLGGIIQGMLLLSAKDKIRNTQHMLHPKIQQIAIAGWLKDQKPHLLPTQLIAIQKFLDEQWIKSNSKGRYVPDKRLEKSFRHSNFELD